MASGKSTDKSRTYSTATDFNITVLISGSGTNLQALIDACGQTPMSKDKPAPRRTLPNGHIAHVISNRREARGLERAQNAHIPVTYHNLLAYKKRFPETEAGVAAARAHYDTDLAQQILTHIPCPDLVVCAGFMHILSSEFVNQLAKAGVPIINLHPALPGKFNGSDAIGRAYKAFQRGEISNTGVMVHYVIEEVDMGKPILVQEVEIRDGDSQEDLEERIHQSEHKLIVEATGKVLEDLEEQRRREA
ncbi:phosphoribosylglycinamide formyltransferase [Exophiala aquamarina CBS 119918]|uniref:Phosphoribosylglycinamide formyltransferase n=1 Tax=Exophiala aquamarina CBS 119918 TaxID=1182545 RepID=A0A072P203_9EURO|nr:phosphoribosylglycinamide formyltransferase [Exophiala aquamarina CBS 119918]KEF53861.1 phosphoribosylglycinamide formyltransferase [Exophiala aquamarina CBS 119918]